MNRGSLLLRSEAVRYVFALAVAFEVLMLFLLAAAPMVEAAALPEGEQPSDLELLRESALYLVLGAIFALTTHGILWRFDAGNRVQRFIFYAGVAVIGPANLAAVIRDAPIMASKPLFAGDFFLGLLEMMVAMSMAIAAFAVCGGAALPLALRVRRLIQSKAAALALDSDAPATAERG